MKPYKPLYITGIGNTLRKDGEIRVYIASNLLRKILITGIHSLHRASRNIEYVLKKKSKEIYKIIYDIVKINAEPGTEIFTEFQDLKHGYPIRVESN
ncbi:MAG: hypothetical protein ABDH32_07845 [Candidatus Caldarchaeales archaeon]